MNFSKIGIIGYGEVGQALGRGLKNTKGLSISVFDIQFNQDAASSELKARVEAQQLIAENNLDSLIVNNELILSVVTGKVALGVVEESLPHLNKDKLFVDMNTVTPQQKVKMGELIERTGGTFIEIAILGSVASYSYKSPMLACGKKARDFADYLNHMGFAVSFLSEKVGQASSMKMLRSVFAKGIEGLLFEMLVAAERCNMLEEVMNIVTAHMDRSSFLEIAESWVTTSVNHAGRRAEEMDHVIETLKNLKVHPLMAAATKERLRKVSELNIKELLMGEKPKDYRKVIKAVAKSNYT